MDAPQPHNHSEWGSGRLSLVEGGMLLNLTAACISAFILPHWLLPPLPAGLAHAAVHSARDVPARPGGDR